MVPVNFTGWCYFWDLDGENIKNKSGLNEPSQQDFTDDSVPF